MKYYALDTEGRLIVYFVLALITIGLMIAIGYFGKLNEYVSAITPSGLMIYVALIAIFDKFVWKWGFVNYFIGVPVLAGRWEGLLTRESANGEKVERKVTLLITQNWRKMSLVFSGESSVSEAQIISMFSENKNYVKIKWVYMSHDTSGIGRRKWGQVYC